jgi:hypothetical protein
VEAVTAPLSPSRKCSTPLTDAAAVGFGRLLVDHGTPDKPEFKTTELVPADFARQLERELAEALDRCDKALDAAEAMQQQRDSLFSETQRTSSPTTTDWCHHCGQGWGVAEREQQQRVALQEIVKGEGAFNRDPLKHATNCIESMRQIAIDALGSPHRQEVHSKEPNHGT